MSERGGSFPGPRLANAPVAIVTGACGGIGPAIARRLGGTRRLVLTDVATNRLDAFARQLADEGHDVAAVIAGDLADSATIHDLIGAARSAGPLAALAHTAGLSPSLAAWDAIIRANLIATDLLLDGVEDLIEPGSCAVLLASMAGHMPPPDPALDALCDAPKSADLRRRMEPLIAAMARPDDPAGLATPAYGLSKRAVMRMAERRCVAWAARGARICTISPGTIYTPMGRTEAEQNPLAARVVEATPMARWGRAADIAAATAFLLSDEASFITGVDLRVDGGVTAAMKAFAA